MAGSMGNSVALMKASINVLKLDKELMVFPMLSGVASVLVMASFIAPVFLTGAGEVFTDGGSDYLAMSVMFLFYVVQYTVIFFFNAALVGAALIRLDGGDPTVGDGLAIASKRMGAIIGYAVIAATVGMILRMISERGGIFAKIAAAFAGVAWTLATYLAVPILVTKDIGAIDAIKESAAVFRRTWGEQVTGNFGLTWAMFLIMLAWGAVSFGVGYVAVMIAPVALFAVIGVSVLGFVFLTLMGSALNGIYTAALYRYAMTGDTGYFDPQIMGNAFRPK
ncbi:MAG: DUF6159 family protein [Gemmatimonadetes bacterium]|nr:DUF6159 family protein [Gemmatimonadota bacterium]MDA1103138.1 DUF6159 family protein [Gemmatimonadota bacterium]